MMGTSYPIARKAGVRMLVEEGSCEFDVTLETTEDWGINCMSLSLTLDELKQVRDALTIIIGYWDSRSVDTELQRGGTLRVDDDPDGGVFW